MVFTSKFVGSGPSSYEKRIYRAAVSQRLRNTDLEDVFQQARFPTQPYRYRRLLLPSRAPIRNHYEILH